MPYGDQERYSAPKHVMPLSIDFNAGASKKYANAQYPNDSSMIAVPSTIWASWDFVRFKSILLRNSMLYSRFNLK